MNYFRCGNFVWLTHKAINDFIFFYQSRRISLLYYTPNAHRFQASTIAFPLCLRKAFDYKNTSRSTPRTKRRSKTQEVWGIIGFAMLRDIELPRCGPCKQATSPEKTERKERKENVFSSWFQRQLVPSYAARNSFVIIALADRGLGLRMYGIIPCIIPPSLGFKQYVLYGSEKEKERRKRCTFRFSRRNKNK